jgi:hypothetical protein
MSRSACLVHAGYDQRPWETNRRSEEFTISHFYLNRILCHIVAPSVLHLPRLSLELEFLNLRDTGASETGVEHTLRLMNQGCVEVLIQNLIQGLIFILVLRASCSVHPTRYPYCKTLLCSLSTFQQLSTFAPSKQLPSP